MEKRKLLSITPVRPSPAGAEAAALALAHEPDIHPTESICDFDMKNIKTA